jgi:hypothetical protein
MRDLLRPMQTAIHQVTALFIDDGPYAFAIVAWVVLITGGLTLLRITSRYTTLILTMGLVVILVLDVWRAAQRSIGRQR